MNEVWNKLINENKLYGFESNLKFYHINTEEMYKKISNLNILIKKNFLALFSSK